MTSSAGAVHPSRERKTSFTKSRKPRSVEIRAVRMLRSLIGVSILGSLNQLQLLHQRTWRRATAAARGEAQENSLDILRVPGRLLEKEPGEIIKDCTLIRL